SMLQLLSKPIALAPSQCQNSHERLPKEAIDRMTECQKTFADPLSRRGLEMAVVACGIACLVCTFLYLFPGAPADLPAPHMPPGFYLGEHQAASSAKLVQYGLYMPPHFGEQKGPFPLIVFLQGYGERG